MAHPIYLALTLAAGSANGITTSQALGAAGNLTINGSLASDGVATLTPARRVTITSAGNDSALTWTIYGTGRFGTSQTESVAGGNVAAATSTQDFLTVTRIAGSAAAAGNVTAGTNDTASTQWVPWSQYATDFEVSFYGDVTAGSPTWQVDITFDDVFGTWLPTAIPFPRAVTPSATSGFTGDASGVVNDSIGPIRASRLTLIAAGTVNITQMQQGY